MSLQIQNLCDLQRIKHEKDIINELGRLPRTLKESYDSIFHRIQSAAKTSQQVAYNAMKWVLCSERTLSIEEFIAAIAVDPDGQIISLKISQVLDMCCNLLVLDEESGTFRFAHLSVREYLEDCEDFTSTKVNASVVERCLKPYTSKWRSNEDHLLKKYASKFLLGHFRNLEVDELTDKSKEVIRRFLICGNHIAPSFENWIWDLDTKGQFAFSRSSFWYPLEAIVSPPATPSFLVCSLGWLWLWNDVENLKDHSWNLRNCHQSSCLYIAAEQGHEAVVKLLLSCEDVDVNLANGNGETALIIAAKMDMRQ